MSSLFMKPHDYDVKKFVPGSWISVKLDGTRGLVSATQVLSKYGKPFIGLVHLCQCLSASPFRDLELDCELVVPGLPQPVSSGFIRNHSYTPEVYAYVFDVPSHKGRFVDRLRILKTMSVYFRNKPIRVLNNSVVDTNNQVTSMYQHVTNQGFEGIVVKTPNHVYRGNRNPTWEWMRMKDTRDIDLRIVGYYEGKGKYEDMLGGVIGEDMQTKVTTRVGGGFSDDEREDLWVRPSLLVGKVIEIAYQYRTRSGCYRHPRFKRFRNY